MSKTEEYLDSLLNNVSPERKAEADRKKRRTSADFMQEFENELDDADLEDIVNDFEHEVKAADSAGKTDDGFFGNLEGIVNSAKEASSQMQEESKTEDSFEVNTLTDDSWTAKEEEAENAQSGGRPVSGDEQELTELLSELPTKEDISNLTGAARLMQEDDGEDAEMEASQEMEEPSGKKEKKSKKKGEKEKGGFFAKLSKLLFGDDEDELSQEEEGGSSSAADDEASQILKELDEAEEAGKNSVSGKKGKGKKKKDKKEKKEKKEKKPKKEKEPKQPKPKKEKKPKKPKEVDLSPPLPKVPVILIFIMSLSVMAFIILSSNLLGYSTSMTEAREAYARQDYIKAYDAVAGLSAKAEDEEFVQRTLLLAKVQNELQSGEALYQSGEYTMSLDSYICALGRCGANYADAAEYNIQKEYDGFREKISAELKEKFGVSQETAEEMYELHDREEYTVRIYRIVKELGMME